MDSQNIIDNSGLPDTYPLRDKSVLERTYHVVLENRRQTRTPSRGFDVSDRRNYVTG